MKLKIEDKEYSLCWGTDALDRYCTKVNKLDDLFGALALAFPAMDDNGVILDNGVTLLSMTKARIKFIHSALESGAEIIDGKPELDLSLAKLTHWADNASTEEMAAIIEDWKKSKWNGATVEEFLFVSAPEPEGKGEAPKKKSRAAK